MHVLDIIQNSIAAEADLIKLTINEKRQKDKLIIKIEDNGRGMTKEEQKKVVDPFVTSRTTRDVGLGLPLFKVAAERCDGDFKLESRKDKGTSVVATFTYDHIDRAPLGDIVGTIMTILGSNPQLDLVYTHLVDEKEFIFDTREIKEELEEVKINQPRVLSWVRDYLTSKLEELRR